MGAPRRSGPAVAAVLTALLSAGLLSAGLLSACGAAAPSAASVQADQTFVAQVHDSAPDISQYRSDVAVIRLGHAACDGFRSGVTYQQLADRLVLIEGANPLPTADLGAVISAAVTSYCPEYEELVR